MPLCSRTLWQKSGTSWPGSVSTYEGIMCDLLQCIEFSLNSPDPGVKAVVFRGLVQTGSCLLSACGFICVQYITHSHIPYLLSSLNVSCICCWIYSSSAVRFCKNDCISASCNAIDLTWTMNTYLFRMYTYKCSVPFAHFLLSSYGLPPAFPTCCEWRLQACGWGCHTLPWNHQGVTPGPSRRNDDPDPQEGYNRYLQLSSVVPWWIPADSNVSVEYLLPWTFSKCLVQYIDVWLAIWKVFSKCSVKILIIHNCIFIVTFEVLNLFLGHWNCIVQMNLITFFLKTFQCTQVLSDLLIFELN